MTSVLMTDWFHNCLVPEVEKYLQKNRLEFKVLLLIDNLPGHPESEVHPSQNPGRISSPKHHLCTSAD